MRNPRRTGSRYRTGWRHILHHCHIRRPAAGRRRRTGCHRSRCTGCSRTCLPCQVAVSRTDGWLAGWLDVRDRGWRSLRTSKLKLTVGLSARSCRQRRMCCGDIIYGLTLRPDAVYGRAGYHQSCWRGMRCCRNNVTAQWLGTVLS